MPKKDRFIHKFLKKLPIALIVALLLFIGAIFLFVVIIHEVLWEKEVEMDKAVFDFLSAHVISDKLTGIMKTVTYFASATFLKIGYAILVLVYLVQKNFKRCIEIAVIGLGGFMVNYFMKMWFRRMRPDDPLIDPLQNFSFPSGHATSAFIFYGLLVYLIWKTRIATWIKYVAGSILLLFSILIGFSRVYLRVHFSSDVLGGFCIGFSWLLLAIWIMEHLKKSAGAEVSKERS